MSKILFKELTLTNFISYGNNITKVNLRSKEPTMIVGINHDAMIDGQLDSNGAGKSTILEALVFCLYDKTLSDKEIGELINNINKKNLQVTVTFEKGQYDYKIIRSRKTKTKADVMILRKPIDEDRDFILAEGEKRNDDITPDSISASDKYIAEKILCIPFEIFARMVVFSATFEPFLSLPVRHTSKTSQTSIMEELFGYKEITDKAEALKKEIKESKSEMNHLVEMNAEIVKHQERINDQIESTKRRIVEWDQSNKDKIKEKQDNLKELKKMNLKEQEDLFVQIESLEKDKISINQQISLIRNNIANFEKDIAAKESGLAKIEDLKSKIKVIQERINFDEEYAKFDELKQKLDAHEQLEAESYDIEKYNTSKSKEIERLEKELGHLNDEKCPYCLQRFENASEKIDSLNSQIKELKKDLKDSDKHKTQIEKSIAEYDEQIKLIRDTLVLQSLEEVTNLERKYERFRTELDTLSETDFKSNVDALEKEKEKLNKQIENKQKIDDEIDELRKGLEITSLTQIQKFKSDIEYLENEIKLLKEAENPHHDMLEELQAVEIDNDKSERINELDKLIKHQEYLLKLLTKKDSFIRKRLLDNNLPFLNKRLLMYLGLTGLPHKVQFNSDMSPSITQFGTEIGFKSLSSGQKARVNLALAFAFRDVLQARHASINLCILDECLDVGLGNVGVQMAAKMIKSIAEREKLSMFIISHRDEITSMFKKHLVIEYKNGFSNIKGD